MTASSLVTSSHLIKNASAIWSGLRDNVQGAARHAGPDIRISNGVISEIGQLSAVAGESIIDASHCVVLPSWVNTHHHLFQSLLKGIPSGIDQSLLAWLSAVPVRYRQFFKDEKIFRTAMRVGLVEMLLSGTTTVADHQYHYYPNMPFDASEILFEEAEKLGMRLVLCRGGGTIRRVIDVDPPAETAPESLSDFMASIERDVSRFHQQATDAMRKMVCAPTTPTWSVIAEELPIIAREARAMGIKLHSHLSETKDYINYCEQVHRCNPMQFAERYDWVGPDVWFAHMVHLSAEEIAMVAATQTGIAHCPQSNCRLGSGIAPVPQLLAAGANVSIGVDGAASNEAADFFTEAHTAWMIHRAIDGAGAMPVSDVIHMGTQAGANILGLTSVGQITIGAVADISVMSLKHPRYFGLHDVSLAPVVSGGSPDLKAVLVAGRIVLANNHIPNLDTQQLFADAQQSVKSMMSTL